MTSTFKFFVNRTSSKKLKRSMVLIRSEANETESAPLLLPFVVVGLLWGATNPYIRLGTLRVESKLSTPAPLSTLVLSHVTAPLFVVPQLLNLSGSVLFTFLLGLPSTQLSLAVPVANGTSILANAVVDWAVERTEELSTSYLCGILCLGLGVLLCSGE